MNRAPIDAGKPVPLAYGGRADRSATVGTVPPGRPMALAAGVAAVLTIYADVLPGGSPGAALLAAVGWLGVGGTWAVRLLGRLVARPRGPTTSGGGAREVRRWLVVPALFLTAVGLDATGAPFAVAFHLSRPALERTAVSALARPSTKPAMVNVGVYGAIEPDVDGPAVYLGVSSLGNLDLDGFAYSPGGPPPRGRCRPLGGPWYQWHEKF